MVLPNFLIIGQIKAGTSSLYRYLAQHPDVYMSPIKETRFFSYDKDNPDHVRKVPRVFPITTIAEYSQLFEAASNVKAIGEASPDYFDSPIAAKRIYESLPNVRLILSLRNPVDRLYSAYLMRVRVGGEKRSFIDAFREDSAKNKWWIISGCACRNLERYYQYFEQRQFKIILFDDFKKDPENTVGEILAFLSVDAGVIPDTSIIYNEGGMAKNKYVQAAYRMIVRNTKIKRLLKEGLPYPIIKYTKKLYRANLKKAPPLDIKVRRDVADYYRNDTYALQELIKRDLSHWLVQ